MPAGIILNFFEDLLPQIFLFSNIVFRAANALLEFLAL